MREWFIVGCKLLGVYFVYLAITSTLGSIGFLLTALTAASEGTFPGISRTGMILTAAFAIVSEIGVAFPLLFKTEWMADTLKLTGRIQDVPRGYRGSQLQPGITLLGIYVFCTKIGSLASVYVASQRANKITDPFAATQPKLFTFSLDFIAPLVTLAVSLALIFGAKYIATFLERDKGTETEQ